MNIYFKKKELRLEMKKKRALISENLRREKSMTILNRLISLEEYKNAAVVLAYVSLRYEVDTFGFIETALKAGKHVAVPRCVQGKPNIDFYFINGSDELEKGSFGIPEPKVNPERLCTVHRGFCVLPGLSFDRSGTRLGYGIGYYDRFLHNFRGTTVGICFSEILSDKPIPKGRFDVPAKMIVTDKETIRVKQTAEHVLTPHINKAF